MAQFSPTLDSDGNPIAPQYTTDGRLKTDTAVTISGDVQIGAVELKDGTTDGRAEINAANTARTTATQVLPVQQVDADGVVGGIRPSAYATDDSAMPATPNIIPVGGEYRAADDTYTDGDSFVLHGDIKGRLLVNPAPQVNTTDTVTAFIATNSIMNGTTALTPKFAIVNVAASQTDTNLVTAVANKKIRVLQVAAVTGATATNLTFNSKPAGAGVAISPLFANGINGGEVLPFSPVGWFETVSGEGLTATTGAGATTGILVAYIEV